MSSTPVKRDEQILSIGRQCSHPACLLVDFLPFQCQHCEDSFCQEHFLVSAHNCEKYDESKYNRVAPNCPLCNTPVAIRPGQDPNIRMDEHLTRDCSVMTGKSGKARTMPVCARGGCKKVLFSPIRCDKCKSQFCPSHRFPADHSCSIASATQPKPPAQTALPAITAKSVNVKASAAGTAAMGAIKKSMASVSISKSVSNPAQAAKQAEAVPASSHANVFSKTNRPFPFSLPSPTNVTPTIPDNVVSMPIPVINYNSFVPRPIFANA